MTDVIVIYPDNKFVIINQVQDLKEYQSLVGGYIKQIGLKGKKCLGNMYINEEGVNKKLPVNELASVFYEATSDHNQPLFKIVGPAIIFGPDSEEKDQDNEQSYTEKQMEVLCKIRDQFNLFPKAGQKSCVEVYRSVLKDVPKEVQERKVENESTE